MVTRSLETWPTMSTFPMTTTRTTTTVACTSTLGSPTALSASSPLPLAATRGKPRARCGSRRSRAVISNRTPSSPTPHRRPSRAPANCSAKTETSRKRFRRRGTRAESSRDMKSEIVRGGGLAGLTTRTELETDALASEPAHTLAAHVRGAGLLGAPPPAPPDPAERYPDELLYEVTAHHQGHVRTARYSEAQLPEEVRRLIAWVDGRPERSQPTEPQRRHTD